MALPQARVVLFVFFTTVLASFVYGSPHSTYGTHRRRSIGQRGLRLESYHPPSTFQTSSTGSFKRSTSSIFDPHASLNDLPEAVKSFVQAEFDIPPSRVRYRTSYSHEGRLHVYMQQEHVGIPFSNAVANIAIKNGQVSSFGCSFVEPSSITPSKPTFPLRKAIENAEEALDGRYNGHPTSIQYLVRPDNHTVSLTYAIQIQNKEEYTWYQAFVDAHDGEVVSAVSFVNHASYKVVPVRKNTIVDGFESLVDPADLEASPLGWHNDGRRNYTMTKGNNVHAGTWTNGESAIEMTEQSANGLVFDFDSRNVDAARTQAFYVANTFHDIMYKYGFTESAFNFQTNNFGKGGEGGDAVVIVVHDPSGKNNARFETPPDGQNGVCRMFLWNKAAGPDRDGVFDNSVVMHELAHGLSGRLTGGGTGTCLETLEAAGLSEGWSDAVAEWVQQTDEEVEDRVMFSANMLHIIFATLVKEYGFSRNAHTDPTGNAGNVVFLHLVIDGMAIQPCNPTFVAARDAIIQADEDRYGGAHRCLLWKVFASRGLGLNAVDYQDDGTVPGGC
ncbi:hypothetical protein AAF712_002356 [Marasmius tenuissimus]|uniref:Extracellular metalloproteinase n=1 Tax=Marasmius tenuissimus TaxID=585030 RepID=A0ABR3AAB7_9AGAR